MSYDTNELSVQLGAPVELYDFAQGSVEWHYTSAEVIALEVGDTTYTSAAIERSKLESSAEKARNTITLTVARNFAIAELFRVAPPSEVISITIRRVHRGDITDSPPDVITAWVGRVLTCEWSGAEAKLKCEPITVSLARTGLRRVYQAACPYALYGSECGVLKTSFDHATTVASISGLVLTVNSVGTGDYSGGFVEWVNDDGITERRFITSDSGTALTLMQPFSGISVSDNVTIYPGCDHTLTTCDATFSNALNYGGQPYFPEKNPFTIAVF